MYKVKLSRLLVFFLILASLLAAPAAYANGPVSETTDGPASPDKSLQVSHRLIVELASPPLSIWAGTQPALQGTAGRLDLKAPTAQNYIAQLKAEQAAFVASLQASLPGAAVSTFINEAGAAEQASYQVVFNGLAIDPGGTDPATASRILLKQPSVKNVYLDYAHEPHLYTSTELINAPAVWESAAVGGRTNAGAGIKFASMDGGVHKDAPMFDGTGYSYPADFPPTGLGLTDNNNGKIIASRAYFRTWDPPAPGDENPWPGETGTSHGVHTAGIAAGNIVDATYANLEFEDISGVAPAAWVMSYRVFYYSVNGIQSFYTAEGLAALEDIVLDGADVLNNSWGGGPSSAGGTFDALDTALINAANAGVFVTMSAGNAGPGKGTTDHPSDEYITVAATSTEGTLSAGQLNVSAPEPVPDDLMGLPFGIALFGDPLPFGEVLTYNFVSSESVDPANIEGCSAWPDGTFTGKATLILRGTCNFSDKVYYAEQAGAEFVVIYNHATGGDELTNMSCGSFCGPGEITIPSVFIGNTAGEAMVDWHATYGDAAELEVDMQAFQAGNVPDVLIDFSSRGPAVGNSLAPDIAAPGVNILSQGYTIGATGEDRHLGFGQVSGTSMAAPHVSGAAALVRQVHPDWTNPQIKSALMSTSKYLEIYNQDGSPAQPLDMGAGRLDLTHVTDPGVILDPPSASFGVVLSNTVQTIDIEITSVANETETYALSTLYTGDGFDATTSLPGFSVSPASITLDPGESTTVTVTFDAAASAGVGDNQGYIILDGPSHDAHLPAWARVIPAEPLADVLILDNDGSSSLGFPDYLSYYTDALSALGYTYDVLDADLSAGLEETFVPEAATLFAYDAVIYFTGDNYLPDGFFTVPTPLTPVDMDRLAEFANNGGVLIAMGQDLAAVLGAAETDLFEPFFYNYVLGGNWLQDSVTGFTLPSLPVVPLDNAPPAFGDLFIDLTDAGDGAANQYFIDEIHKNPSYANIDEPDADSKEYVPLLKYPGPGNVELGVVGMAHRAQPSLENPGVSYFGRSVYTTFGLEGVNDDTGFTTRAELLQTFFDWAQDEPEVTIADITPDNSSALYIFEAALTSNLEGVTGVSYRWDFGDGTGFTSPSSISQASHQYALCKDYTVRVEATDSFGNVAIGTLDIEATQCAGYHMYFPYIGGLDGP